jgi:hypothetical protein
VPFGTSQAQGFTNKVVDALQAGNTIINRKGFFIFSGTPGTGNLLLSIAPFAGVILGNTYTAGFKSYLPSAAGDVNVNIFQNSVFLNNGTFQSALNMAGRFLSLISVSGTTTLAITMPIAGGLNSEDPNSPGNAEGWHNLTLINGWTANASFGTPRYRKVPAPSNEIEIDGVLSGATATSGIFATLGAGYIPGSAKGYGIGNSGGGIAGSTPNVREDAAGNLSVNNATLGVAASFFIRGFINLDA